MTLQSGWRSAKSVAQMPVPVPMSKQELRSAGTGHRMSLLWNVKLKS